MTDAKSGFSDRIPNSSKKIHGIEVSVDAQAVRLKTRLSQTDFCDTYGFNLDTFKNWEQKRRKPDPTSAIFLHLIDRNPDLVKGIVDALKSEGLLTQKSREHTP